MFRAMQWIVCGVQNKTEESVFKQKFPEKPLIPPAMMLEKTGGTLGPREKLC